MTAINKHAELRQLAEKATPGEWWSDVVETDGEYGEGEDRASGYHSYAVYVGNKSLLDMTNSSAACIHTEWDHDYLMAWDEIAKRNAEFIAAFNPKVALALLDEVEASEHTAAVDHEAACSLVEENEELKRRIAELEARTVTLPPTFWYEHDDLSRDVPVLDKRLVKKAIRAAGIKVKGERDG